MSYDKTHVSNFTKQAIIDEANKYVRYGPKPERK